MRDFNNTTALEDTTVLPSPIEYELMGFTGQMMVADGEEVELEKIDDSGTWNVIFDEFVIGQVQNLSKEKVENAESSVFFMTGGHPVIRIVEFDFDKGLKFEEANPQNSLLESGKSVLESWNTARKKHKSELSIRIKPQKARMILGIGGLNGVVIRQQLDGLIYFNNEEKLYRLISYSWEGPQYRPIITTDTKSKSSGKTGRKGRLLGAAVGSLVAPGLGTAVGLMVGTGSKTKGKTESQTVSSTSMEEVPVTAQLVLEEVETGRRVQLDFPCLSDTNAVLSQFTFALQDEQKNVETKPQIAQTLPTPPIPSTTPAPSPTANSYEELKKLKELLDLGILTQEEFNKKKYEILGL